MRACWRRSQVLEADCSIYMIVHYIKMVHLAWFNIPSIGERWGTYVACVLFGLRPGNLIDTSAKLETQS
jgi:hypothetical protein